MIHLRTARRGAMVTLLAMLVTVPVVVTGATSASANPKCTGKVSLSASSRPGEYVGWFSRNRSGRVPTQGAILGSESVPIIGFTTNRAFRVTYRDLANNNSTITTHNVGGGGTFSVNPCHWATVWVL